MLNSKLTKKTSRSVKCVDTGQKQVQQELTQYCYASEERKMSGILKKICNNCKFIMKKQTIGLNVLYYCPQCGIMSTANSI